MEPMEICEEKYKKRPRKSPSPPPPEPRPLYRPRYRPWGRSLVKIYKSDYEALVAKFADLNLVIDFERPLDALVCEGIVTDYIKLRSEESLKQSWDSGLMPSIPCEDLLIFRACDVSRSQRREGRRYLFSAAENKYFEAPPPEDRPDLLVEGLFLIYPEDQRQMDPIFEGHPNFMKFVPWASKLAQAAVEYHNFITGAALTFSKMKKANLHLDFKKLYYYITLEANDKSGKEITCQSRVVCYASKYRRVKSDTNPVVIDGALVTSFCCVK